MADKVYAPAPAPGPIEKSLEGKTPQERAASKAQLHGSRSLVGYTYTLDGVTVTISRGPVVRGNAVGVGVGSAINALGVSLPLDDWYYFANPPIKVPNGTYRQEPDATGAPQDVANFREDIAAAAERMLLNAILYYARLQGFE